MYTHLVNYFLANCAVQFDEIVITKIFNDIISFDTVEYPIFLHILLSSCLKNSLCKFSSFSQDSSGFIVRSFHFFTNLVV